MSFVPVTAASTAGAAAAAAHQRALREEEETMTPYSAGDLDGWEFKIVRSATRKFKDRETVRRVCEEEAVNGWQLVEKFDDNRMRFKRRTERRAGDSQATRDPYRTQVGLSSDALGLAIVGVVLGLIALGGALAFYFSQVR